MKTIDIQNKHFQKAFKQVKKWFMGNPNRKMVQLKTGPRNSMTVARREDYFPRKEKPFVSIESNEELLAFAQTFSENYHIIEPGDYISPGDYKYHIKYVDKITTDGVEPPMNMVVEDATGMMVISRSKLEAFDTNPDFIFYLILWFVVQRNVKDEEKADLITMVYYLTTGRSVKNVIDCHINLFSAEHNSLTFKRVQGLIDFINSKKK